MKSIYTVLIAFLSVYSGTYTYAQEFVDKEYYLVDSLIISGMNEKDSTSLQLMLIKYHSENEDTVRLGILSEFVNYMWDIDIWPKYTDLVIGLSEDVVDRNELCKSCVSALAMAYFNKAFHFKLIGNPAKSIEYYRLSAQTARSIGDLGMEGDALNNIARTFHRQGNIERSLEIQFQALKLFTQSGNKNGEARSLNNMSLIYREMGEIKSSLEYYQRSLAIYEEIGDFRNIALAHYNLSFHFHGKEDSAQYIFHLQSSLAAYRKEEQTMDKAAAFYMEAMIHNHFENQDSAIIAYELAMALYRELVDNENEILCMLRLVEIYYERGELETAYKYAHLAKVRGEMAHAIVRTKLAYEQLTRIFKKQEKWAEALESYEVFINLRDSLNNEENQKTVIRQQTKYEFEKAQLVKEQEEKEVGRLKLEATSRRDNLQYSIVLICLLVIGGLVALLGRMSLPERVAEGLIFFAFLLFFEFLLVLADPYIEAWSGGAPGIKLLFNAGIAALIFPLHSLFERKLKRALN